MTILDQMVSADAIQPSTVFEVFLLQLAKRLQDERQIGWYVRYAPHDIAILLHAYRQALRGPTPERAARFRNLILKQAEP
jgi:hypothetical protein